jgi:regulator of RNase E activity RraB
MPFNSLRRNGDSSPDGQVIAQLRKHSNLAKPHEIEFFLYFPTQELAERAAQQIRERGFKVEVSPPISADDRKWLAFATKSMLPKLEALEEIRRDFTALAESLDGEYDGWGTPFVK